MTYPKTLLLTLALITAALTGCNRSQAQDTANTTPTDRPARGQRGARPSVDEVFKMDANGDGKLAKAEVKGPLQRNFDRIDADGDGFITREEFANAPRPERGGQRPRQ